MRTALIKIFGKENFLVQHLDTLALASLYTLSFLIPFVVQHPQLLVGICINTLILLSTLKYGFKKTLPILILPSIAAYSQGLLFGGATIFLLYFIPFIILSNGMYSLVVEKMKSKVVAILISSTIKASLLFAIANIYVNSKGLPEIFLKTMGMNQLITALVGGIIAFSVYNLLSKKSK